MGWWKGRHSHNVFSFSFHSIDSHSSFTDRLSPVLADYLAVGFPPPFWVTFVFWAWGHPSSWVSWCMYIMQSELRINKQSLEALISPLVSQTERPLCRLNQISPSKRKSAAWAITREEEAESKMPCCVNDKMIWTCSCFSWQLDWLRLQSEAHFLESKPHWIQ